MPAVRLHGGRADGLKPYSVPCGERPSGDSGSRAVASTPNLSQLLLGLAGVFEEVNDASKQCDSPDEIAGLVKDYADGFADEQGTKIFESSLEKLVQASTQFLNSRGRREVA